jgi:N-acyl-D-aspartate/D-glutamate deacylase
MFDVVIRSGTVINGTGGPPRTADVAIRDGHVVNLGNVTGSASRVVDTDGGLVRPASSTPHPLRRSGHLGLTAAALDGS